LPGIEDEEEDEYFGPDEFDAEDMEDDVDSYAQFELEELDGFLTGGPYEGSEDECWFADEPADVDLTSEDFDGKFLSNCLRQNLTLTLDRCSDI
jgi:hypothetical protein